jgi:hypothetical protein
MKYTGWCQNDLNVQGYIRQGSVELNQALTGTWGDNSVSSCLIDLTLARAKGPAGTIVRGTFPT